MSLSIETKLDRDSGHNITVTSRLHLTTTPRIQRGYQKPTDIRHATAAPFTPENAPRKVSEQFESRLQVITCSQTHTYTDKRGDIHATIIQHSSGLHLGALRQHICRSQLAMSHRPQLDTEFQVESYACDEIAIFMQTLLCTLLIV